MSTTLESHRTTYQAGDLVIVVSEHNPHRGRTATVLTSLLAGRLQVKVIDGPVLSVRKSELMDAAEFWEREDAHR